MPSVLCGLAVGLETLGPSECTADAVARAFATSLDPALSSATGVVEVYRLERIAPDAVLGAHDSVMCCIPDWSFDFHAVEELLHQLDDLKEGHDCLQMQYSRTKEAFIALSSSIEATEAISNTPSKDRLAAMPRRNMEGKENEGADGHQDREVQLLRQQLAHSEKKQQESKSAVLALRKEFMHLVSSLNMVTDAASAAPTARAQDAALAVGAAQGLSAGPDAVTSRPARSGSDLGISVPCSWLPDGNRAPGSFNVAVDKLGGSYGDVSHTSAPGGYCAAGGAGTREPATTGASAAPYSAETGKRNLSQPPTSRQPGGGSGVNAGGRRAVSPQSQRVGGPGSVAVPVGSVGSVGQLSIGNARAGAARPRGVRQRADRSAGPAPLRSGGTTGPSPGRLVPGGDGYAP